LICEETVPENEDFMNGPPVAPEISEILIRSKEESSFDSMDFLPTLLRSFPSPHISLDLP
jgi:hypothetical protein